MNLKFLDSGLMDATSLAGQRQVVVNVSSSAVDRDGDIVVQEGIKTASFLATGGTVLFSHDPTSPVAKCVSIGIVTGKLRAVAQFPPPGASRAADECYNLVKNGVLCAASIGFSVLRSEPIDPNKPFEGRRFLETELMEFSFVSTPSQREATVVAKGNKSGRVLSAANAASLAAIAKCLANCADAHDEAIEHLKEAAIQRKRALRHAARIAQNVSDADDGDDELGSDDDDDSDVELSFRSLLGRRSTHARRSSEAARAERKRVVDVMARSHPHVEIDPGRERRMREVTVAERRASP